MKIELFHIGPLTIYGYGLMIALGILAAFSTSMTRAKRKGMDTDALFNMGLIGIACGLVGAKLLYYVVEFPSIWKDPSQLLQLNEGFVVYGGLVAGFASPYLYARIKKLEFWRYLDVTVAGVALAQGFGRIGCFLAGCCYGMETDSWFGVVFPEGSLAPAGVRLIPTQLISSVGDFLFAVILMAAERKNKKPGMVSGLYLVLYSVGRFLIEFLRDDPRGSIGMLSTSQFIALFTCALGAAVMAWSGWKVQKEK
ncbi:MAG: prolipoprotein diacylglyceryl transferase [Lachnospiraceae bacterium]|nr:prolipoprotein diacylglyceryl transferase [Lachnospiraceae bacterium]